MPTNQRRIYYHFDFISIMLTHPGFDVDAYIERRNLYRMYDLYMFGVTFRFQRILYLGFLYPWTSLGRPLSFCFSHGTRVLMVSKLSSVVRGPESAC